MSHDTLYARAHAILRDQLPEIEGARLSMALDLVLDAVAAEHRYPQADLGDTHRHGRAERVNEVVIDPMESHDPSIGAPIPGVHIEDLWRDPLTGHWRIHGRMIP